MRDLFLLEDIFDSLWLVLQSRCHKDDGSDFGCQVYSLDAFVLNLLEEVLSLVDDGLLQV